MKKTSICALILILLFNCTPQQDQPDRVIMKAGKLEFTAADLDYYMASYLAGTPEDEYKTKKEFLEGHLEKLLVADAGIEIGLLDSVEVDSNQDIRIINEILYKLEVADKRNITEAKVKEYWDKYGGDIWVSQIVVKSKELADSLFEELQQTPDKFSQFVREFSIDSTTRVNDGKFGPVKANGMLEHDEVLFFTTPPGEIAKPRETYYGWHIVRVDSRLGHTDNDLRAEYGKFRKIFSRYISTKLERALIQKAQAKFDYTVNEENLQKIIDVAVKKRDESDGTRPLSFYVDNQMITDDIKQLTLATFDGYEYKAEDFLKLLIRYFKYRGQEFGTLEEAKEVLSDFSSYRLLYSYGLSQGLDQTPAFKRMYQDAQNGYVFRKMETDYIQKDSEIPQEEIRKYYDDNIARFEVPRRVKISVIASKDKAKADSILALLKSGNDFDALLPLSEHESSRNRGGDFGYTDPSAFANFYTFTRTMRKGELGGPVLHNGLFYVFKVTEIQPKTKQDFEEAKFQIGANLKAGKMINTREAWLENRKKEVENFIDLEWLKNNLETGKLNE